MIVLFLLFAFGFVLDYVWCGCVRYVQEKRPFMASSFTMVFVFLATYSSWEIIKTDNWKGLIVYVLGQGLGSFVAVSMMKRKEST